MLQNLHRCAHHFFRRVIPLLFLICIGRFAQGQVVISQVYGGGGNSGATLRNDFIELFNSGSTTIDLTGMSIQYASSTGNFTNRTNLSGSIAPGKYYLIQQAQGSGGTTDLPTPDATGTITMSATAGKVALVNSTTALGCGGTASCSADQLASILDLVGFGSGEAA